MGPTSAGKTDLALELAERLAVEIVSVDSAMVYRGLDIGTAKPSREIRERIPHHLVDVLDPAESYSAGQFLHDALQAIRSIHARGRISLLVGGTMLYFHTLLKGLARLPSADVKVRRELDARLATEGAAVLHAELRRIDPEAADRIHPNDPQRIQRALEVHRLTGRSISALQSRSGESGRGACASSAVTESASARPRTSRASVMPSLTNIDRLPGGTAIDDVWYT